MWVVYKYSLVLQFTCNLWKQLLQMIQHPFALQLSGPPPTLFSQRLQRPGSRRGLLLAGSGYIMLHQTSHWDLCTNVFQERHPGMKSDQYPSVRGMSWCWPILANIETLQVQQVCTFELQCLPKVTDKIFTRGLSNFIYLSCQDHQNVFVSTNFIEFLSWLCK